MENLVFMYLLQNVLTIMFVFGTLGYLVFQMFFSKQSDSPKVPKTESKPVREMRYI